MAEEPWHAARLIPVSGIGGAEEQERRGTSALLAVLGSVREFGRTLTGRFGAPAGQVETFIEVPFQLAGKQYYPDGLIRISRGKSTWVALVEVKTGRSELQAPQLEAYLDIAREHGFQAVLTVSNQIPAAPGQHPVAVDRKKLKKVELVHLSWAQIHTEAIMEKVNRSVADPDQAWILSELIRYLEHPRSGAVDFEDMGPSWVHVRDGVSAGTLHSNDKTTAEVAQRWEQLLQYAGMRLGRTLGTEVHPALTRRELSEPGLRVQAQIRELVEVGQLTGRLKVPNTVAELEITVDLRAGRVSCAAAVPAPTQGRALTRVNWLLRQLKDAPIDMRVDSFTPYTRGVSRSELIGKLRADPALLLDDAKRDPRGFQLVLTRAAGSKRGQGKGTFVTSVLDLIDLFYQTVLQTLRPWSPAPPKVHQLAPGELPAPAVLTSTALSSQDHHDDQAGALPADVSAEPEPAEDVATQPAQTPSLDPAAL